ncbi:DNA mismatch repair protein Mlh1 isoform X2 [Cephus cinctus]|nr:DNA mismatch repair protein Mlh1 isoform X2 [Cephus cinctus]
MEIVCERFTTSKLQTFEDLKSISTFGFRGEALASISHVALLTIITKTVDEKCAYKGSYIDGKLKAPLKPCAGNQGTTITIENLFYNVATRRKAFASTAEEFAKISEVVTRYAIHNPKISFTLKKHGEVSPQVRTQYNSTHMNNIRTLFGNPVARELLEIDLEDVTYKFKMHALVTNPNYSAKRMTLLLFINHRLVDSTPIRKMLEDLYSIYLPKKTHPWCYVSLEINSSNIDVNVHPTKHEVRFLHEDSVLEKMKIALDEKLASNSAARTFYLQARLPKVDITKETLKEVLPEYDKNRLDKTKKIHAREMIRTDSSEQKLDKFNFTIHAGINHTNSDTAKESGNVDINASLCVETNTTETDRTVSNISDISNPINNKDIVEFTNLNESSTRTHPTDDDLTDVSQNPIEESQGQWSAILNNASTSESTSKLSDGRDCAVASDLSDQEKENSKETKTNYSYFDMTKDDNSVNQDTTMDDCCDPVAKKALEKVYQYLGNPHTQSSSSQKSGAEANKEKEQEKDVLCTIPEKCSSSKIIETKSTPEFKSYSVNNFMREVKLMSVLTLRKEVEDNYHEGLREILSNLIFVGCVNEKFALIQSGVNLYICDTQKLAEELFYEIMIYDFANYGVIRFSDPLSLYDLAMLGLETEEAGWTEEVGKKEDLSTSAKELLLEKADMLKEYFSIVIDKKGYLKSLPILLEKYFPYEAELPLYILRLATEVDWTTEQPCFQGICRETAKLFGCVSPNDETHDWKHVTEHILYPAIKESLLPPKHFAHDSTILQIASLPDMYKVFERC